MRYEVFGHYTPGQQALIVGKLEFNVDGANERLRAWVNPTGEETASIVSHQITADLGWTSPRCMHLRNWSWTERHLLRERPAHRLHLGRGRWARQTPGIQGGPAHEAMNRSQECAADHPRPCVGGPP